MRRHEYENEVPTQRSSSGAQRAKRRDGGRHQFSHALWHRHRRDRARRAFAPGYSARGPAQDFSKEELCDVGEGAGRTASLAARFAAKEACLKLFPRETALGLIGPADFALARDGYGAPRVVCSPRALELIARYRVKGIAVSLAHDKTSALAVAVAELASPGDQGPRGEPDRTNQGIG